MVKPLASEKAGIENPSPTFRIRINNNLVDKVFISFFIFLVRPSLK
jgi:hypothetical protein